MKVKKLLIGLLVSGLALSFAGCGGNTNATDQIFMYDKDTKIVYVYTERSYSTSTMPYYVLDENGKPEIAVYGENYNG